MGEQAGTGERDGLTRWGRSGRRVTLWLIIAVALTSGGILTGQAAAAPGPAATSMGQAAEPTPEPTATPTPEPVNVSILCHEFLSFSNTSPVVGETIDVTFHDNCRCEPMDVPGSSCDFLEYELSRISAPGFEAPATPIGPPGPTTIQMTATTPGRSGITLAYYGEDSTSPPGLYRWTTRSASATIEVQEAEDFTELTLAESCLAGNGRVDFNVVNQGTDPAVYRIEFGSLSARQLTVAPGDWGRLPITGRADGSHPVVISRNGEPILDRMVTFTCDEAVPTVSESEVSIVNSCRSGLGYVVFQIVNPTETAKGYVISFESVRNRSTTAAAYGQALRAATGRPNGDYSYEVHHRGVVVAEGSVTVNCRP